MKPIILLILAAALAPCAARAVTFYVDASRPDDSGDGLSWASAKKTIQAAVSNAAASDVVVVTNGLYNTGLHDWPGLISNVKHRVVIDKALTVRSINGPDVTIIAGAPLEGGFAVRCVALTNGAVLEGFTISNGVTRATGDSTREQSGGGVWCIGAQSSVARCIFSANRAAADGGGLYRGSCSGCVFSANSANAGGGTYNAVVTNTLFRANIARTAGGAQYSGSAVACLYENNFSSNTCGAAYNATLYNCTLRSNAALYDGGGAYNSTLYSCLVYGNRAGRNGGGVYNTTLENCTVVDNCSSDAAGGVYGGTVRNSIVYFNDAYRDQNYGQAPSFSSSCTLPHPGGNNISNDPRIVSMNNPRLLPDAPCRDAGVNSAWMSTAVDMDGEPRLNGTVDIGADEVWPAALSGALHVAISTPLTQAVAGAALDFTALIDGRVHSYVWQFSDGGAATNRCAVRHAYAAPGSYTVILTASNASAVAAATVTVSVVSGAAWYVQPGGNDALPGTNWATAKQTIQAAVDAANTAGGVVWLNDGMYNLGDRRDPFGSQPNRIVVAKPITVRSVNGPSSATIMGAYTSDLYRVRCAYLDAGAALEGLTLRYGWTLQNDLNNPRTARGAGVWAELGRGSLSNCIIVDGHAYGGGGGACGGVMRECVVSNNITEYTYGGGALYATLLHSVLISNRAVYGNGGAAAYSVCHASALTGNRADSGAGGHYSTLYDCAVAGNRATYSGGGAYQCTASNATFTGNTAGDGGGALGGAFHDCTFTSNYVSNVGGAARQAALTNCLLQGNRAASFGGAGYDASFINCLVTGNMSSAYGGGAMYGTHYNSVFAGNRAQEYGGAAYNATLFNCTLTGNTAFRGGGASGGTLHNCIAYYNTAATGANYYGSVLTYSCAAPRAPGAGNTDAAPGIVSVANPRLAAESPCINAGSNMAWMSAATDIEGEARLNGTVDIGADEYWPGGLTGGLSAHIVAAYTQAVVGAAIPFQAAVGGKPAILTWSLGDTTIVSNQGVVSHAYATAGTFTVVLRAANATMTASDTVTVQVVSSATLFVATTGNDSAPGTNWAAPKATIQAAIDAAAPGALVMVSNGLYATGGRSNFPVFCQLRSRLVIDRPIEVRSVHGPAHTIIAGQGPAGSSAVRGVFICDGAILSGFTISNGATLTTAMTESDQAGGGMWAEPNAFITNCMFTCNRANAFGGGLYGGQAVECVFDNNSTGGTGGGGAARAALAHTRLTRNVASLCYGGAAYQATLASCIVHSNAARTGGGIYESTADRTIISANNASAGGGGVFGSDLIGCVVSNNACDAGWSGGGMTSGRAFNSLFIHNLARVPNGYGGGAASALLVNCTVMSNAAANSGGVNACVVSNSVIYYNNAAVGTNFGGTVSFHYSCTWPMPGSAAGTITNEPGFVDVAAGNVRLAAGSPCIGAAVRAPWMLPPDIRSTDLDGQARLAYGAPDMGAYEYVAELWCDFIAAPTQTFLGARVQFYSMVAGTNRTALFYRWDFQDQGSDDLAGYAFAAPPWTYLTPGTKTIACVLSNAVHETALSIRTNYVTVIPEPGLALLVAMLLAAQPARRLGKAMR